MATENKSLKYFMRPVQQEIIAFTGPESFKDETATLSTSRPKS